MMGAGQEIPDRVRDEEVQDRNDGYGTSRDYKKSAIQGTSGANAAEARRSWVEPGMRGKGTKSK